MNLNEMRRFGVEVEFFSPHSREELASKMYQAGIEVHCVGYTNRDTNLWRLKPDSSLTAVRRNGTYYYPMELVTPILHGEEDMQTLKKIVAIINEDGYVDVGSASVEELRRFCYYAGKYERAINKILPRSRRESRWARNHLDESAPLTAFHNQLNERGDKEGLLQHRAFNGSGTRYMKWNFDNYWRTGTVENRAHSGTTDNWVRLVQGIIERNFAAKKRVRTKKGSTASTYNTRHMLSDLVKNKAITETTKDFYLGRYEVLNNEVCR